MHYSHHHSPKEDSNTSGKRQHRRSGQSLENTRPKSQKAAYPLWPISYGPSVMGLIYLNFQAQCMCGLEDKY